MQIRRFVCLGAAQGAAAWAAYAVVEFMASSVLFGILRPYALYPPWHWRITALLFAAYLAAGLVLGAAAGAAVWLLSYRVRLLRNPDSAGVLEAAATFTVVAAFAAGVASNPLSLTGKYELVGAGAAFALVLAAAMRSPVWARRFGLLTNAWVASGLLLGVGQGFALAEVEVVARQFGANMTLWSAVLVAALVATALAAIAIGRKLRPLLTRTRLGLAPPAWASLLSAAGLLLASVMLAAGSSPNTVAPAAAAGHPERPNVLMVVLDTVRADRLSVYGYERDTTPNLRKFAGDSVVYRHAVAASDMTLASHASLFTGMYPSWHGAHCDPPDSTYGRELDPQARTLAEILSHNGYSTFGVSSNMYLRADFGLQRGFGAFRIPRPVPILTSEQWYLLRRPMRSAIAWFADTSEFYRLFARSEDATRELLAQASRSTAGAPFFAFVNYMDAHFPYVPPAPFDGLFPGKDRRTAAEDLEASGKLVLAGGSFPDSQQRHVSSQYDGAIAYMDAQVGRILDWLRDSDLYDNTMIVVTSDHGEQFGEKNLVLHGNSAYQELLHVPLIIRYPRGERTGEVDETVSLVDVVPTILDSLGYEVPPQVQGRSLLDSGPRIIYAESFPCPVVHSPKCPGGCTTRAALSGPHKLILSSNGSTEFYDVVKDPAEKWNLLGKQAPDEQRLGAELAGWLKTRPPREKQSNQVDQETLRRLKSLGYVQ